MKWSLVLWGALVVAGLAVIGSYQVTPGHAGDSPMQWPSMATIPRDPSKAMLIMFAHPNCPCTKASIDELAGIMSNSRGLFDACVAFVYPGALPTPQEQTDNWNTAAAIPGVRVIGDPNGTNARLFGIQTSGHVVLYDRQAKLAFQGGITSSRGHRGDNAGVASVNAIMKGNAPPYSSTPVFGCALMDP